MEAGRIATMNHTIRTLTQQAGIPLTEAVRMASESPAAILGINHRKGSLAKGKDADIILFDSEINVSTTLVEGRVVYGNLSAQ
jgi:N-acetylglucosamine-6-phosphate deacetylase